MAAPRSPVLGYNHNVRYRGVVFHVQTEDAGSEAAHVDTHLFRNGAILVTQKTAYAAEDAETTVRALMKSQHITVLRDLNGGSFDEKIVALMGWLPAAETGHSASSPCCSRGRPTPPTGVVVVRPAVVVGGRRPATLEMQPERSLDDVLRALLDDEEK